MGVGTARGMRLLGRKLRVGGEDIRRSVASESDRKAGWELEQPEG